MLLHSASTSIHNSLVFMTKAEFSRKPDHVRPPERTRSITHPPPSVSLSSSHSNFPSSIPIDEEANPINDAIKNMRGSFTEMGLWKSLLPSPGLRESFLPPPVPKKKNAFDGTSGSIEEGGEGRGSDWKLGSASGLNKPIDFGFMFD